MQQLAGLNESLESKKAGLKKEIEGILYQYVDDINNARGISAADLEQVAEDLVNYIVAGVLDIANS